MKYERMDDNLKMRNMCEMVHGSRISKMKSEKKNKSGMVEI